jgi:hypothetical protein
LCNIQKQLDAHNSRRISIASQDSSSTRRTCREHKSVHQLLLAANFLARLGYDCTKLFSFLHLLRFLPSLLSNCTIRSASIISFHFREIAEVKRWREQEGTRRFACSQDPFSKVFARDFVVLYKDHKER